MWAKFRSLIYNPTFYISSNKNKCIHQISGGREKKQNFSNKTGLLYTNNPFYFAVQSPLICPQSKAKTKICLNFNMCL